MVRTSFFSHLVSVFVEQMPITQVNVQSFTAGAGTYSYTPSGGMLYCIIEAIGSGGGGGGSVFNAGAALITGGGGGAGGYSRSLKTAAQVGGTQVVTIGAVGTGGTAGANPGTAGGDTSVGALVIAKGGSGGAFGQSGVQSANGGAGGVNGTGDITVPGNPGQYGFFNATTAVIYGRSGYGGSGFLGGGPIGVLDGDGVIGGGYGSGGSGGASTSADHAGGNGRAGVVIVTEFIGI